MTDLIRRFSSGEIRAVVAQSDEMAIPAAEVVQAEGWKETLVFGFDGSRTAFEAIRKGGLEATILQDPLEQGKKAVETIVAHLRGQTIDPEIITPPAADHPGQCRSIPAGVLNPIVASGQ